MTIVDNHQVEMRDLGSNFFLVPSDVGSLRSVAAAHKLQELNKMTKGLDLI